MKSEALAILSVVLAAGAAFSEEETPAEPANAKKSVATAAAFTTLPCCSRIEGSAEARLPLGDGWAKAVQGHFYPFGTEFRTDEKSSLVLSFGGDCEATLAEKSSFSTRLQEVGLPTRTVVLGSGTLELKLSDTLKEGTFFVTSSDFTVKNPAGSSKYVCGTPKDGIESTVRCVTGSLAVDGRHFTIPEMRAADEFRLRASHDHLATLIYGTSGDYVVRLDRGERIKSMMNEDGQITNVVEKGTLDWHLSPTTKIQIDRLVPSIGERMSVSVMTFDAAGELQNRYAFSEGRAEIPSDDDGPAAKSPEKDAAAAAAKAAAEATSTEAEETTSEGDSTTENATSNNESSAE